METNSTNKLITIAKNKGIKFSKGDKNLFKKYSYFQVVNAYKNIFAYNEETIDEIKRNILNNINIDYYRKSFQIKTNVLNKDLYELICDKICKKYGLCGETIQEKEKQIRIIRYHHHIYQTGTLYTDFVRMYKFEHELRMMLLKYILIVEESVKNIFTSYLNDKKVDPNYLVNMDSYNTISLKSRSFDTMKLIIDKYDNLKSKPIKRKRDQHLNVPYWIIINELAMNQTYHAIANLNAIDSYKIFLRCLNFFTELNFSEENRGKTLKQINYEKKMVNNFKTLLCYLGEFRNMLAHNQPIYCYNVLSYTINSNHKFKYELPVANPEYQDKFGNKVPMEKQQVNIMGSLMNSLTEYFGKDNFNSNNSTKLDLSKIIYVLYKMLKHIDKNTNFYSELIEIYSKYNIILSNHTVKVENVEYINDIKKNIIKLSELKNKNKEKEFETVIDTLSSLSKRIIIKEIKSKYKHFSASKRYTEFTGINKSFFTNIK